MSYQHRARVLVTLGSGVKRGRIVSKVEGVSAYVVALHNRRITVPATQLTLNAKGK